MGSASTKLKARCFFIYDDVVREGIIVEGGFDRVQLAFDELFVIDLGLEFGIGDDERSSKLVFEP